MGQMPAAVRAELRQMGGSRATIGPNAPHDTTATLDPDPVQPARRTDHDRDLRAGRRDLRQHRTAPSPVRAGGGRPGAEDLRRRARCGAAGPRNVVISVACAATPRPGLAATGRRPTVDVRRASRSAARSRRRGSRVAGCVCGTPALSRPGRWSRTRARAESIRVRVAIGDLLVSRSVTKGVDHYPIGAQINNVGRVGKPCRHHDERTPR